MSHACCKTKVNEPVQNTLLRYNILPTRIGIIIDKATRELNIRFVKEILIQTQVPTDNFVENFVAW